jgi:hypothetical protein
MVMSAYFIACLAAFIPAAVRFAAQGVRRFGKALFAAMHESRHRQAAHELARYRDLIADANSFSKIEQTPAAGTQDAADRRNDLLAFGQAIPFQSAARIHHAPRIGGRSSGATWRGTWRGAQ